MVGRIKKRKMQEGKAEQLLDSRVELIRELSYG